MPRLRLIYKSYYESGKKQLVKGDVIDVEAKEAQKKLTDFQDWFELVAPKVEGKDMLTFSQRYGYEPLPEPMLLEELSSDLRREVWNTTREFLTMYRRSDCDDYGGYEFIKDVLGQFLKLPHDEIDAGFDTQFQLNDSPPYIREDKKSNTGRSIQRGSRFYRNRCNAPKSSIATRRHRMVYEHYSGEI